MRFTPDRDLLGLNELRIAHATVPRGGVDDPGLLQDMRDAFARDLDRCLQWLYRRGRDFRFCADAQIDPRELVEALLQDLEEHCLAPIDRRIEALGEARPPAALYRRRPGPHGAAP
ncbi:hypothetical protein [Labrys wisconsinensis]|uniref:Uncharacterized protein n=1 Tax=Labrys wisconsinensis TaxID=425677 RepID=A0ABU0JFZ7_9HYPH|nr:hypothetical protein [Labrys wisconsinensis]MDQ0473214.1 hypothetical protein [Labrys wisconsinensis]